MEKKYNKSKQITIFILLVLVVCLAASLLWYIGTLKREPSAMVEQDKAEPELMVVVPKIDMSSAIDDKEELEYNAEKSEESLTSDNDEEENSILSEDIPIRTDGKPRIPEEAIAPEKAPIDAEEVAEVENPDENGICRPEPIQPSEEQPQGGDTNSEGAVYVPGFGYIENSGSNEQGTSYTDGNWNTEIGTMQ